MNTYERGLRGELLVEMKLGQLGFDVVKVTSPTAPFDVLVRTHEGKEVRIEVKTSSLHRDASGEYFKFIFSQPIERKAKGRHIRNGRSMKPTSHYDVAVLIAVDVDSVYYFVLPSSALQGKNAVRINRNTKNGKFNKYLNAFHFIG